MYLMTTPNQNVKIFNRYEQYAKKMQIRIFHTFFTEHAYLNQFI